MWTVFMEVTAVIVDDEPLARVHLKRMLETQNVDIIGEASNVTEAIQLVEDNKPDLLFMDIQMPGMTGIQMADLILNLDNPPLMVFVTGYSEHAVTAFDKHALDYLLKPVSQERLIQTLMRARARLNDADARSNITQSVHDDAMVDAPKMKRLPIRDDYAVKLLRFEDIVYAEAKEKRVFINTKDNEFRTYYTLKTLETILPADNFIRIHDSYIVNMESIEELIFLGNHAYEVKLNNGKCLPVGRTRYADFLKRFGVDNP